MDAYIQARRVVTLTLADFLNCQRFSIPREDN
jgi:hypothetical protein